MSEKIHRQEYKEQLVFIWFLEQDTGSEKNVIKVYAVASSIEEAMRQVMSIPSGQAVRSLVENTQPTVCASPFAEVNISANGKVASMIQAERRG